MKRYNNNGKSVWAQNRQDSYPVYRFGGRPPVGGRRDGGGNYRPPGEDSDMEGRPSDETHQEDRVSSKLDRVLEKLGQLDVWKEEADRKFDILVPALTRDGDMAIGVDEGDDPPWDDNRRRRPMEKGFHPRNPNLDFRDGLPEEKARREERGRTGPNWGFQGDRQQNFNRPAMCWDLPQRYKSHIANYEKPQRVKMQPPRFNRSDVTNWVSRVQYYFDHVMMPDAERLHYAVMLFDLPAAEWVFNYCANNEFVMWQDFMEDVRHRFDRQSFKNYYGLLAKLTQTGTVLEYHDTFEKYLNRGKGVPESDLFTLFVAGLKPDIQECLQLHRSHQTAPPTGLRQPWQNRESRGQRGSPLLTSILSPHRVLSQRRASRVGVRSSHARRLYGSPRQRSQNDLGWDFAGTAPKSG
ncbi:uncharacterized protein LOC121781287 [Salvia splendens]|uniref:uncharacterized protein LOC121781287 n=1 Tax=Salvia splendens TaxID=180675 RepID=UPI001C2574E2|nr:uncharacterized protein LOC121781287 [Salvia splendens]XP_042034962.1 uncharacterized protein LOC121781287 [Salvia splendens]